MGGRKREAESRIPLKGGGGVGRVREWKYGDALEMESKGDRKSLGGERDSQCSRN